MTTKTQALTDIANARSLAASGAAKSIRVAAHLTLTEIASEVGVTASAVCRWERGQRSPRGDAAREYGHLLRQLMEQPR